MKLTDWLFGSSPTQLKLASDDNSYGTAKIGLPKPPPLDVTLDSLLKYSRRSELVYACIEKKAQAACDAVLTVEKRVQGEWAPLDSHPLTSLLNKPNPWDNGESFLRSWVASENFSDNFYCEIVRSGAGLPVGLYPLNPVFLVPQYVMDSSSWRISYYYYYQTGFPVRLEVDDLLVRRRHGLGSIYSDVSSVQIALGSVDADSASTDYVRAFFNNGGMPSGILTIKDKRLSDDEAKAMQQRWLQKYGRAGTNQRGVAILDQSAEFQSVGSKLNELENEQLNAKIETRICMAFGVPPIIVGALVGLKHITQNATAKAAMGEFWQHTMSPELKSMRNWLTWTLLPMFEPIEAIKRGDIRCNWDMGQVVALQEDIDGVHSRVGEGFQNGIYMLNEARSKVGLDPAVAGVGDKFVWELNAQKKVPGQADPNATPPPPAKPPKKSMENLQKYMQQLKAVTDAIEKGDIPDSLLYFDSDPLDADTILEKKTFNFNGLTLSREPTELEKTIDLKGMVIAFDRGKVEMATVLISLRGELIKQSEGAIAKLSGKDVHELTLVPPDKAYSRVHKAAEALFVVGQRQVADDLNRQKSTAFQLHMQQELEKSFLGYIAIETKDIKDKWKALIDKITDRTVSRIINEIQTRAINFFVARGLLKEDDEQIISELRAALEDQSLKTFEDMASQTANASIGAGRDAELEARKDEIGMYEYSAILDANTCDECESHDGEQSTNVDDLPEAPNPDCEGGSRCRCFIVGIGNEENA